jgi:hypothetical protein
MLPELFQSGEQGILGVGGRGKQARMPQFETELLQQPDQPVHFLAFEQSNFGGIERIERHADGYRLAVQQCVSRQGFQFMCAPVPVVQRPCVTRFKGIAAVTDLPQVQFRAAFDQVLRGGFLPPVQRPQVRLDPVEKLPVPDQGDFDCLGKA